MVCALPASGGEREKGEGEKREVPRPRSGAKAIWYVPCPHPAVSERKERERRERCRGQEVERKPYECALPASGGEREKGEGEKREVSRPRSGAKAMWYVPCPHPAASERKKRGRDWVSEWWDTHRGGPPSHGQLYQGDGGEAEKPIWGPCTQHTHTHNPHGDFVSMK